MSSEATDTQLLGIGRALIAVLAIVVVLTVIAGCGKDSAFKQNFDQVKDAVEELDRSIVAEKLIILDEDELGVFFREDSHFVAQTIETCWMDRLSHPSGDEINPSSNCLIGTGFKVDTPAVIDRPANCQGNCFCILQLNDPFSKFITHTSAYSKPYEKKSGNDIIYEIGDEIYNEVYSFNYKTAECSSITKKPAKIHGLLYAKEAMYLTEKDYKKTITNLTEYTITYGGAIITPTDSEVQSVYFCRGQTYHEGFYTVKYEELCSTPTPFEQALALFNLG